MKFVLLSLISIPLFCAPFTASVSGDWASNTTWGGAGVPGNGDTCTINNGITVTINTAQICGNSPASGNIVLNFDTSGKLIIANGGSLSLRGDGQYSGAAGVTSDFMELQEGSTFQFDNSLNPTQRYTVYPSGDNVFRGITSTATSTNFATITTNGTGLHGGFWLNGHNFGGRYTLPYVHISKIGDSSFPAFEQMTGGVDGGAVWNLENSTVDNSGLAPKAGCSLGANDIFKHNHNVHTNTLSASIFTRPDECGSIAAIGASGVREVNGNVFDKILDTGLDARDFTFISNYLTGNDNGVTIVNFLAHGWAKWQNNFYRVAIGSVSLLQMQGDVKDSIFLLDEPLSSNPHGLLFGASSGQCVTGSIIEHTGSLTSSRSAAILTNVTLAASSAYCMNNNILPPNAVGGMTFWLSSIFSGINPSTPNSATFTIDHNTVTLTESDGVAIDINHSPDITQTHEITSYRGNILWNPSVTASGYKLFAGSASGVDACAPDKCDYNNGYHVNTDGGGFTNGANGYAATFSSAPGQHDISLNPLFVDSTRNIATFDSTYLNHHYTTWNSGNTYTVGDFVSFTSSVIYTGLVINYRYTNGTYDSTSCSNANPEPGALNTTSRACWEWASLYHIREDIKTQKLYDDQTVGASGVDIITVLIGWIRAGFSPQHPGLAMTSFDGLSYGAVQSTLSPQTTTVHTDSKMKGKIKGGKVR